MIMMMKRQPVPTPVCSVVVIQQKNCVRRRRRLISSSPYHQGRSPLLVVQLLLVAILGIWTQDQSPLTMMIIKRCHAKSDPQSSSSLSTMLPKYDETSQHLHPQQQMRRTRGGFLHQTQRIIQRHHHQRHRRRMLTADSEEDAAAAAILLLLQQQQSSQSRIVGGNTVTSIGSYPFMAQSAGSMLCGATLIHNDILLTAAHCAGNFIEAGALVSGILTDDPNAYFHSVETELIHPQYTAPEGSTGQHDIMLVKLADTNAIPPVPLASPTNNGELSDGETAMAVGYGATYEGGGASSTLNEASVSIVNFDTCASVYSSLDNALQFCTSSDGGKDTCQGDSGGPILNGNGVQIGIISYGEGCARYPSVNTKVATYYDWIQSSICQLSKNPPSSCSSTEQSSGETLPSPTTPSPTTAPPSTPSPTTSPPTTPAPTVSSGGETTNIIVVTSTPTTLAPTPSPPSTPVPTTAPPTTPTPTTAPPTTPSPTTAPPITPSPTTTAPITPAPTTGAPTTPAPTTFAPILTFAPTRVISDVPSMVPIISNPTTTVAPTTPAVESQEEEDVVVLATTAAPATAPLAAANAVQGDTIPTTVVSAPTFTTPPIPLQSSSSSSTRIPSWFVSQLVVVVASLLCVMI